MKKSKITNKFDDSIAVTCRYGDIASKIWHDWNVVWEDSESDYQGHASFVVEKGGKFAFYEWWYGSCSGCDGWEASGMSDDDVEKEMRDTAMWFKNKKELLTWLDMLEGNPISNYSMESGGGLAAGLDMLGGGLISRINAIRNYFGMSELKQKKVKK